MRKRLFLLGMLVSVLVMFIHSGQAATVDGHAYKDGVTDHSGITIDLDVVPQTPTIRGTGLIMLLLGFSLFIFRKRDRRIMISMLICFISGLTCFVYAGYLATTVTNSLGEYDFTSVEPGNYDIDAFAPGYYPDHASFTVAEGANTAPDLTLYPIPTGTPTNTPIPGGYLISTDNIVGNMRYAPSGTFTQGAPGSEPCRNSSETQFSHTLTQNIAVMQTEVTRQMWADLKAAQSSLPIDPTDSGYGSGMNNPVQSVTWYEAVLFANLLSLENGFTQVYYLDSGYTIRVDATNYTTGSFYMHPGADGYRLATEGEWEYFCRAGTTETFSFTEPSYTSESCIPPS